MGKCQHVLIMKLHKQYERIYGCDVHITVYVPCLCIIWIEEYHQQYAHLYEAWYNEYNENNNYRLISQWFCMFCIYVCLAFMHIFFWASLRKHIISIVIESLPPYRHITLSTVARYMLWYGIAMVLICTLYKRTDVHNINLCVYIHIYIYIC